jgi:sirohydrochlorin ferrochelatase
MIALIDNGSLEAAAHQNLRSVARALAARAGAPVAAVSWKHSDRIPAARLDGAAAHVIYNWIRDQLARGERDFLFVPFFISPQGAIGSALRRDLEAWSRESGGFSFAFCAGLADQGALAPIVAARVREALAARPGPGRPAVVVVDHGGPARASAALRDAVAAEVRSELGDAVGPLAAASLESPDGPDFAFNQPLFAEQLAAPGFDAGDVVVAPLFLAPGRHAGPSGDLARIARAAEARAPGRRIHFTGLVGTHPQAVEVLARSLQAALSAPAALPS